MVRISPAAVTFLCFASGVTGFPLVFRRQQVRATNSVRLDETGVSTSAEGWWNDEQRTFYTPWDTANAARTYSSNKSEWGNPGGGDSAKNARFEVDYQAPPNNVIKTSPVAYTKAPSSPMVDRKVGVDESPVDRSDDHWWNFELRNHQYSPESTEQTIRNYPSTKKTFPTAPVSYTPPPPPSLEEQEDRIIEKADVSEKMEPENASKTNKKLVEPVSVSYVCAGPACAGSVPTVKEKMDTILEKIPPTRKSSDDAETESTAQLPEQLASQTAAPPEVSNILRPSRKKVIPTVRVSYVAPLKPPKAVPAAPATLNPGVLPSQMAKQDSACAKNKESIDAAPAAKQRTVRESEDGWWNTEKRNFYSPSETERLTRTYTAKKGVPVTPISYVSPSPPQLAKSRIASPEYDSRLLQESPGKTEQGWWNVEHLPDVRGSRKFKPYKISNPEYHRELKLEDWYN